MLAVAVPLPQLTPIDAESLEAVAARAWSPQDSVLLGPWLLRSCDGFSRSGNAAAVLGDAGTEQTTMIARVERFYADRGLPPCFEIAGGERHDGLVRELVDRGYRADEAAATTTMATPLRLLRSVAPAERDGRVRITDAPTQEWVDRWWSTLGLDDGPLRSAATDLCWELRGRCGFAGHVVDGELVATGLAVVEGPWAGLFCIGTSPDRRRRGSARRVVGALATWAIANAAKTAYAAVPVDLPSQELFRTLRFEPLHDNRFLVLDR
jgi:GNAT superfamily N-acetyltransferase